MVDDQLLMQLGTLAGNQFEVQMSKSSCVLVLVTMVTEAYQLYPHTEVKVNSANGNALEPGIHLWTGTVARHWST